MTNRSPATAIAGPIKYLSCMRTLILGGLLLLTSVASAQYLNYTSGFGGLKIVNAKPLSKEGGPRLAANLIGLADLKGYKCTNFEGYVYPNAVETIGEFKTSARQKGFTYTVLTQLSQDAQNVTLFRVSRKSLIVIGLSLFASDGTSGTLTLCKALKK